MNIMAIKLDVFLKRYEEDLKIYDATFKKLLASDVQIVDTIVKYVVKNKGKRLRPLLTLMAANLVGKPTPNSYIVASIVELLHTASLVHDDVVDEAAIRRGFPSINAVWKNKVAVLMGDYMLSKCLIGATQTSQLEIMEILAHASKRLSKGELLQIEKTRKMNITENDYYQIISDKTAALLGAASRLGAFSIAGNHEDADNLQAFGENLGIAFQIQDDLLDFNGNQKLLGKPVGNDLKDKKITLPLIYALNQAESHMQKQIKKRIKKGVSQKDIKFINEFVKDYGGIDYSVAQQSKYVERAKFSIDSYPNNMHKEALIDFVDFVIKRKK
jgi:octaprenyl-diphosphate synthase